ncbi:MAG: transketolase, partial [Gemmatimonadota bacterium]|nr:transketolase [Gemmatimonadota bacterium]
TSSSHGAALGEDEVRLTKQNLDWPSEVPFEIPEDVLEVWREAKTRGASYQQEWEERFAKYESAYDTDAAELKRRLEGKLPVGWSEGLPAYNPEDGKVATRMASGAALSALGEKIPELIGGSADLAGSVMTKLSGTEDLTAANHAGRMMYFGVREHAMTAVMNGMALHGGVRPFGGTFLIFADYMRPAIRLAAMMNQPAIYLLSHDSIGLGEDGPTHQPVETLASLRAIPNLVVLRPADGNEVVSAWKIALERNDGPTAIVLTRQGLPVLDRKEFAGLENVSKGGYVLAGGDKKPDVILMASGSEIELAIKARRSLAEDGIEASVVNMVSMEIFAAQPMQYRDLVLPPEVAARVAVEAAHPMPWYQWIGSGGSVVGLDGFGASGPASELFEHFGLTAERVVSKARAALGR